MVGQDHVARALGNALRSGRPAQGYLFSGPRGTGQDHDGAHPGALPELPVEPRPDGRAVRTCDSCRRTGQPDWMDVVEVDAASSARRIDEMREWLETVRYAPVACRYRITIMDEAHQIQDQAASALLKTLEEPPPHLVVILCTTHPWEILGTIRSRLQHYVLRKPGLPALVKVLDRVARAEDIQTSESGARHPRPRGRRLVPRRAGPARPDLDLRRRPRGGLGRARADRRGGARVDLRAGGPDGRRATPPGASSCCETVLDGPVDPEQAMRGLVGHLRYVCLLQQGARPRDEWSFSPEEVARLQAQANQLPDAQVVRGLDLLSDAQLRIRHGGADPRLQLELVAARLARPALDASAGALAARVEALESAAPRTVTPPPPPLAVAVRAPAPGASGAEVADELPAAVPARLPRRPRRLRRRRTIRPARSWSWTSRTSTACGRACSRRWSATPRPRAGSSTAPARRRSTSGPSGSRSPARCAPRCWGSPSTASGCGSAVEAVVGRPLELEFQAGTPAAGDPGAARDGAPRRRRTARAD